MCLSSVSEVPTRGSTGCTRVTCCVVRRVKVTKDAEPPLGCPPPIRTGLHVMEYQAREFLSPQNSHRVRQRITHSFHHILHQCQHTWLGLEPTCNHSGNYEHVSVNITVHTLLPHHLAQVKLNVVCCDLGVHVLCDLGVPGASGVTQGSAQWMRLSS